MRIPIWSSLRLAPRIIVVIVAARLAVKAVDKAMPLVIPPPDIMFFDRDWLLATLREARDRSNAVSAADRPAMLQKLPARQWLDFTPLGARPEFRHAPHGNAFAELRAGAFADLHRQIADTLGLAQQDVLLMADDLDDPEYRSEEHTSELQSL